jgi:peroxiredoxin
MRSDIAYTQIVTIATDEHHELQEFRASVGAQWSFLSDPGPTVQKDLEIREYTDPFHGWDKRSRSQGVG